MSNLSKIRCDLLKSCIHLSSNWVFSLYKLFYLSFLDDIMFFKAWIYVLVLHMTLQLFIHEI